jgi:uncharacterized damage-inducible protein DinB
MTDLGKLVQHCNWANQAWIDLIAQATADARDEYLSRMISHVLLGEQAWFQRIMRQEIDRNIWRVMPVDEMRQRHQLHVQHYAALLGGDVQRIVEYRRFTGEEYRSSIGDILLHLCTHGMHHRGQMAAHASKQGLAKPSTDFINFCIVNNH